MKYHIETYGCQMNVYDSGRMEQLLEAAGYEPAETLEAAEIVLLNTCAVRESAEQRVWGQLGHRKRLKENGACRMIGLCGCMAQNHGEKIFERAPQVDLVMGTGALASLPAMIDRVLRGQGRQIDVELPGRGGPDSLPVEGRPHSATRAGLRYPVFVAVMRGCNHRCTYCVVPRVRGSETYRPAESVCREVRWLIETGYREVTLIGQAVTNYRVRSTDFAGLLRQVAALPGLERLRFATSHPKRVPPELIDAIAEEKVVCEHLHLPAQSGSDRILRRMARGYTAEQYLRLCERIRERIPGASITGDLIVGFPGETENDFQATLDLMEAARWDGGFLFKYSPREGTAATRLSEAPVPPAVAQERFERALELQLRLANEANQALLGQTAEILLEEVPHPDDQGTLRGDYKGRTRTNKMVVIHPQPGEALIRHPVGDLVQARIIEARAYSLTGTFADSIID